MRRASVELRRGSPFQSFPAVRKAFPAFVPIPVVHIPIPPVHARFPRSCSAQCLVHHSLDLTRWATGARAEIYKGVFIDGVAKERLQFARDERGRAAGLQERDAEGPEEGERRLDVVAEEGGEPVSLRKGGDR